MPTTYKVLGQTTNNWSGTPLYLNAVYDGEFYGPNTTAGTTNTSWSAYNGQSSWSAASTQSSSRFYQVIKNTTDGYSGNNSYDIRVSSSSDSTGTFYLGQNVAGTPYATNYTPGANSSSFAVQNRGKVINFGFAWKMIDNAYYNSSDKPEMRIDWWKSGTGYISSSTATASESSISGNTWYKTDNTTATVPADAERFGIQIKLPVQNVGLSVGSPFARIDSVYLNLNGYNYSIRQDLNLPTENYTYVAPYSGVGTPTNVTQAGTTANTTASAIGWASAGDTVTVYTVPTSTSAVVSSLLISNLSTSATTYRIAVVPSGQTLALKHFISFDEAISANSSVTRTLGITLAAGDKIQIISPLTVNQLSASAFGSEIS